MLIFLEMLFILILMSACSFGIYNKGKDYQFDPDFWYLNTEPLSYLRIPKDINFLPDTMNINSDYTIPLINNTASELSDKTLGKRLNIYPPSILSIDNTCDISSCLINTD
ncbi:hypothetical protein [Candidatus Blochmannia ocreatus (nom. nud.)]|uniref:Lipoprotein n=1 Tax=Candidatus Blochmannia ocreatus (nom. nud.) TaxID=251538 RepID=A0ABY4SVN1_9ENTR|nr:hypothetical protein [Candidatus Blochmannia ocreatus]URJ25000.1 hypothetical protein M9405_02520 [Candidatus Blochmannia ocreatus]